LVKTRGLPEREMRGFDPRLSASCCEFDWFSSGIFYELRMTNE
jgi:hypothetical protein